MGWEGEHNLAKEFRFYLNVSEPTEETEQE